MGGDSSPLLHGVCEERGLRCTEGLDALPWSSRPQVSRLMLAGPPLSRGRNPSPWPLHVVPPWGGLGFVRARRLGSPLEGPGGSAHRVLPWSSLY